MIERIALFALGIPAGIVSLLAGIAIYQQWTPAMSWALLIGLPVTVVACAVILVVAIRSSQQPAGPQIVDAPSRMLDLRDEGRWLDNRIKWARLMETESRQPMQGLPAAPGTGAVAVNDRWLEELA